MIQDGGGGTDRAIQRAAIVGAGPAGLIAFAALRYRGLSPSDVAVFDDRSPLSAWTERTDAILQVDMRSESDGHLFPTDYPGFALLDAVRRRTVRPLLLSAVNRYHPTRFDIQRHGRAVVDHFGIGNSLRPVRAARLTFSSDPEPHAVLLDASGVVAGRARHVLLALGHGELRWPDLLVDPAARSRFGSAVVHAYQTKSYGDRTYLVVGSGMAAAGEWTNMIRAGGRVIAVRRNPEIVEQPLSAPRCYFGGPLLDRFHTLSRDGRAGVLRATAKGSYPASDERTRLLQTAARDGRMESLVGHITSLEQDGDALVASIDGPGGVHLRRADMVIAATGFRSGWRAHPLLQDLVASFGLDTEGDFVMLSDDCTIPLPDVEGVTVTLSGPLARWVFPPADSFAGMKYVARRFADTVHGRRANFAPGPLRWWRMVRAGAPEPERRREVSTCASH